MKALTQILVLSLTLSACSEPGGGDGTGAARGSNLLLVTLDTTRADRIGCYGKADAGTGTLDGLAARGVRFERCFSVAPITLPSHSSILSGRLPFRHGARNNGTHQLPSDVPTLATALKGEGYRTGAVVSAFVLDSRFGLAEGFDSYNDDLASAEKAPLFMFRETKGDDSVRRAKEFLAGVDKGKPWFLWLHLFDPHANYEPPAEVMPAGRDPYQGEIAFADKVLGDLLQTVATRGETERTLVAVTADHGESLGQHGEKTHGLFIYDATTHVPLILAHPRVAKGFVVEPVVSSIDLAPTLLDLLGVAPSFEVDGRSLAAECVRGSQPSGSAAAYSEGMPAHFDHGWSDLRSLREESWRFVRAPRPELFLLADGKAEGDNRFGVEEAAAGRLERDLEALLARGERDSRAEGLDAADPAAREALAALGYASGQAEGRIGEGPLADPKDKIVFWDKRNRAMEAVRQGDYEAFLVLLRELAEAEPADTSVATAVGDVLRKLGRKPEALEWMRRGVDSGRGLALDWLELGVLEHELGLPGWRERLANARALAPNDPIPWVREGDFEVDAGRFEPAEKAYAAALALDERCAEALVGRGHLLHQQQRESEAETVLLRGLQANPRAADGWFNLGVVHEAQGRSQDARRDYEQALQHESKHVRAMVNLGALFLREGDRARAGELYQRAHEQDGHDARVAYNLALLWIEDRQGRAAEELIVEALAASPGTPQLLRLKVFAIEAQGEVSRAGVEARALLVANPKDAWLVVLALEGLLADGEHAAAQELLRQSRALGLAELESLLPRRPLLAPLR